MQHRNNDRAVLEMIRRGDQCTAELAAEEARIRAALPQLRNEAREQRNWEQESSALWRGLYNMLHPGTPTANDMEYNIRRQQRAVDSMPYRAVNECMRYYNAAVSMAR